MATADALIARLALEPHPEGGWYRRVYRASLEVDCGARRRPALTSILYLLKAGEFSRWHRVASDEAWHFYSGAPLRLITLTPDLAQPRIHALGDVTLGHEPVHVVPASCWQAARSDGPYSLVGCTVGPGFDFDDFELMADVPAAAATLRRQHPALSDLL